MRSGSTWALIAGAALAAAGSCTLATEGTSSESTTSSSTNAGGMGGDGGSGANGGSSSTLGTGGMGGGGTGGMAPACPDPVWGKRLAAAPEHQPMPSPGGTPFATRLAVDSAGRILVASGFTGTVNLGQDDIVSAGGVDLLLASFDGDGILRWAHGFGPDGNTDEWAEDVAVDSSDNALFTGFSTAGIDFGAGVTPSPTMNAFVVKFDPTGALVWSRDLPFSHGLSMAVDSTNAAVIAGYVTQGFEVTPGFPIDFGGGNDVVVAKWSSQGNLQWVHPYGDTSDQRALGVATGPGNAIFVTGDFEGTLDMVPGVPSMDLTNSSSGPDAFLFKLASNGNLQWAKQFTGENTQSGRAVAVDSTGAVVVVGKFDTTIDIDGTNHSAQDEDVFVAKFDSAGTPLWSKAFGGFDDQDLRGVAIGPGDTIYLTGHYLGTPDFGGGPLPDPDGDKEDVLVAVLDATGKHLFSAGYGDLSKNNRGIDIAPAGCSVLVSGSFDGTFSFAPDAQIIDAIGGFETFLARYYVPVPMP
jgi:hypothetical protein